MLKIIFSLLFTTMSEIAMADSTQVLFDSTQILQTTNGSAVNIENAMGYSAQVIVTNGTPANKDFVDADVNTTSDAITETGHGFVTGLEVRLTTTGVLPGGLSTGTDYFVIVLTSSTFQLATSYANAVAGTDIDITSAAGGGTHTVAVATLDVTPKIQASVDGTNWDDVTGMSEQFTAAGNAVWSGEGYYKWVRLYVTHAAGYPTVSARLNRRSK